MGTEDYLPLDGRGPYEWKEHSIPGGQKQGFGPNFERAGADSKKLKDFATELGIVIPSDVVDGVKLYDIDMGCFFSTDNTSPVQALFRDFVNLVKLGKPLLAFGKTGYGFGGWSFSILCVDEKFGYFFTIPFGDVFEDKEGAAAKRITEAFKELSAFKKADNVTDFHTNWTVVISTVQGIRVQKIDKATGKLRNAPEDEEVEFRVHPQDSHFAPPVVVSGGKMAVYGCLTQGSILTQRYIAVTLYEDILSNDTWWKDFLFHKRGYAFLR
ncbi:MAG: hypothetical protein LBR91_00695 [Puniceicoccales bacterium]|jgi:hypothetical protein|nr:hypothetical protein [Puniceicoccales bacterium]